MPADRYEVSVIICVRNGEKTIVRQLDALGIQKGAPVFEVLVVDNRSTDKTREIVQRYLEQKAGVAYPIRLLLAKKRVSIPYARNIGALASQGRVLAFCDADDEVDSAWVAAFSQAVSENVLAGGQIIPDRKESMPASWGSGLFSTGYLSHVANCNCAIERETFLRIGGYDESLPAYGFEDVELSWHAHNSGVSLVYVPEAKINFTVSDSRSSIRKRFHLGRGRVLMAGRYPAYDSQDYTPARAFSDLALVCYRVIRIFVAERKIERRYLGQIVSALGRLVGSFEYVRPQASTRRQGINSV